jgi:hypothetical protein
MENEHGRWEGRAGRLTFYQFDLFLQNGWQFYAGATLNDLRRSWRITKRILKTRARPRVQATILNGKRGLIVYRLPRIHGEESLTETLNAMKCTSESGTYL